MENNRSTHFTFQLNQKKNSTFIILHFVVQLGKNMFPLTTKSPHKGITLNGESEHAKKIGGLQKPKTTLFRSFAHRHGISWKIQYKNVTTFRISSRKPCRKSFLLRMSRKRGYFLLKLTDLFFSTVLM